LRFWPGSLIAALGPCETQEEDDVTRLAAVQRRARLVRLALLAADRE
jgi:hypothetical protein